MAGAFGGDALQPRAVGCEKAAYLFAATLSFRAIFSVSTSQIQNVKSKSAELRFPKSPFLHPFGCLHDRSIDNKAGGGLEYTEDCSTCEIESFH